LSNSLEYYSDYDEIKKLDESETYKIHNDYCGTCNGWVNNKDIYYSGGISEGWPQGNFINIYNLDKKLNIYIEFKNDLKAKNVTYEQDILVIHLENDLKEDKKEMFLNIKTNKILKDKGEDEECFELKELKPVLNS